MRGLIIPTALIVIVLVCWGMSYSFTINTGEELLTTIKENLVEAIVQDDWALASENYIRFEDKWHEIKKTYTLYMPASSVTDIDLSIARAGGCIAAHDKGLAISELTSILEHFDALIDNQRFSVDNLF